MYLTLRLLQSSRWREIVGLGIAGIAIGLAHFGTLAAALLFAAATALALPVVRGARARTLLPVVSVGLLGVLALALVRVVDPVRYRRVFIYLRQSVEDSLLGSLLGGNPRPGFGMAILGTMVFFSLLVVLWRLWIRFGGALPEGQRIFWLANILFSGFLLLPVLDEHLTGRLGLFLVLPMLFLLIFCEAFVLRSSRARAAVSGAVGLALVVMAVGEITSLQIHNRASRTVRADLDSLGEAGLFGTEDLVVARTGADHVCNWFFRVRAGVVTSLTLEDFERYETVYLLNPLDRGAEADELEGRVADSEASRYLLMRSNPPPPASARRVFTSESVEVFELAGPPEEWTFTPDGSWYSYDRSGSD